MCITRTNGKVHNVFTSASIGGWLINPLTQSNSPFYRRRLLFPGSSVFHLLSNFRWNYNFECCIHRLIRVVNRCIECHLPLPSQWFGEPNDIKVYFMKRVFVYETNILWAFFYSLDNIIRNRVNVFCTQYLRTFEISLENVYCQFGELVAVEMLFQCGVSSFDFTFCPFIVSHSTTSYRVCCV